MLKAMCLHVAHACNMDCEYCFAGKGEYHGAAGLMSYETGKAAMDYLVVDLLKRFSLPVSEPRQKARESAEAYFAKIAAGDITPESYGSDGTEATSGPAIEVVAETRPRVTAAKLEGL